MELNIPIKEGARTKAILKLLNPFLSNLTETEMTITARMLDMNIEVLDKENRNSLRMSLDMGKYLFNNYIQSLKGKNILYNGQHSIPTLNKGLRSIVDSKSFNITFVDNEN